MIWKIIFIISNIFFASACYAQTDSGLIPNNTVLGNTSGGRALPRPIAIPTVSNNAVFNPRDYGALCDGVTNDYAAITAAISAAQAAGGGVIQFPGGTGDCMTNQTILLSGVGNVAYPNNFTGSHTRLVIKGTGLNSRGLGALSPFTGSCLMETKGFVSVENMYFTSNAVSINGFCNTAEKEYTQGVIDDVIIDKSFFNGFSQSGNKCIYNGGPTATGAAVTSVLNTSFRYCWYAYYSDIWNVGMVFAFNHAADTRHGIYFTKGSHGTGGYFDHTEGIQIIGNEILAGANGNGRALEIDGVCYDCHIAKNIFDSYPIGPNTCPTLAKAVRIRGSASTSFEQNWLAKGFLADAASAYGYNNQLRLVNNSFPGCAAFIVNMFGGIISNNSFFGFPTPITALSMIDSTYFTVTGNVLQDSSGLGVSGSISNCVISSNVVSNSSSYSPCVGGLNVGGGLP